jgi:toxin HigB-1
VYDRTDCHAFAVGAGFRAFSAIAPVSARHLDRYKRFVYNVLVIRSFADSETERFWGTGTSRRLPTEIRKRAAMRLLQLDASTRIDDLRMPPSNRLEALRGDRSGQWSVRINERWRLCFRFEDGDAHDVEIVDYH